MPKKQSVAEAKTTETLMNLYESLPELEQGIINLLSVFWDSTARTHIVTGLRRLKIKEEGGRYLNLKLLTPFLDKLSAAGFLEVTDGRIKFQIEIADPVCIRLAETGQFKDVASAVHSAVPLKKHYRGGDYPKNYQQFIREIRIGFYQKDGNYVKKMLSDHLFDFYNPLRNEHPYVVILKNIHDPKWLLENSPQGLLDDMVEVFLKDAFHRFTFIPAGFRDLLHEMMLLEADELTESVRILLAEYLILQGKLEKAEERIEGIETKEAWSVRGMLAFLRGRNDEAIARYETAMQLLKKSTRKRKIFLNDMGGLFYLLALIKTGSHENMTQALGYAAIFEKNADARLGKAADFLRKIIKKQQGEPEDFFSRYYEEKEILSEIIASFVNLMEVLYLHWARKKKFSNAEPLLNNFYQKAGACGFKWFEAESMELLSRITKNPTLTKDAATFWEKSGIESLADCIKPDPEWKRILSALNRLKQKPEAAKADASVRLAWLIGVSDGYSSWDISPREQKITAGGKWGKGRPIALKRLKNEPETFDYLTPQDFEVCSCIQEHRESSYGYYYNTTYSFSQRAIKALIGHPLVFLEDSPKTRVEIVKGEPELCITRAPGGKFRMSFPQKISEHSRFQVYKETPTRVQVMEVSEDIQQIAKYLDKGITVPEAGKDDLLKTVSTLSSLVTINSAVGGAISDAEKVKADTTPRIHLIPYGQGLKISLLVRPFTDAGPYFRPGEGGETVISEVKGEQVQTRRNLEKEKKLADQVISECPTLAMAADNTGEWVFEDPETSLEVLTELQTVGKSAIIAWPEGERFKITQQADTKRFHLRVKKQQDWFAVSGELKLDDGLVLDMQELFALIEKSPGRFIQLNDGQFLALTRSFRKQLDELRAYSSASGKSTRFHPLAALALNELTDELGGLRGDKHWKAHIKQLQEVRTLQPPIPSTLKAELRDYQTEGVKWLMRLSHWGVGACLADDMGLGKTVQALAVLLQNASKGPSLVVAPTSVCMNWQAEAEKFAPTLNVHFLGNGNREKILDNLKAFDLLIVSYGLLQQEKTAELLSKAAFQTIVLDEAQAIKNFTTKRSKGAMALQGGFKLITTGTPIENNLSELWNLFRFINPGLLGSLNKFNEKFATPIERDQDRSARGYLKKLIQPFMLRRTKNQVLTELPPRTDVVLPVELSTEEIAMYEALRQKAVENLMASDDPAGGQHLQILAEIMKLRRACCHPRLVMPDADLSGSKLAAFGELVDELLEGKHKALVFSQFVGHLKIIEEFIQEKKIAYQYLDGSTPQKERKKRVDAFQAGEGDLFLISLKAGGLGLNLTAADYVIHMDPWWNPAVEDQASDRTHRIGQKRPVTVYRLVARHTIEEKIVALHQQKRDLADNLLKGADMSGKISSEELLKLLSEAAG